jgi:hypothetical protein
MLGAERSRVYGFAASMPGGPNFAGWRRACRLLRSHRYEPDGTPVALCLSKRDR